MHQTISGVADGTVMVWSNRAHRRAFRFTGHQVPADNPSTVCYNLYCQQAAVLGLACSSHHHVIASASKDATIRLWQPSAYAPMPTSIHPTPQPCSVGKSSVLKAHTAAVRAVDFADDGHHLVSCSNDKSVKVCTVCPPPARHKHMCLLAMPTITFNMHVPTRAGLVSGDSALCAQLCRPQQLGEKLPVQHRWGPDRQWGGRQQYSGVGRAEPKLCRAN